MPTYEYTFGGPIARRQLWFFNAGRFQEQQSSLNTAVTSIPYIRTNDEKRYEIKGTYSPMAGHTGRVAYSKIDQQVNNFLGREHHGHAEPVQPGPAAGSVVGALHRGAVPQIFC